MRSLGSGVFAYLGKLWVSWVTVSALCKYAPNGVAFACPTREMGVASFELQSPSSLQPQLSCNHSGIFLISLGLDLCSSENCRICLRGGSPLIPASRLVGMWNVGKVHVLISRDACLGYFLFLFYPVGVPDLIHVHGREGPREVPRLQGWDLSRTSVTSTSGLSSTL